MGAVPTDDRPEPIGRDDIIFSAAIGILFLFVIITSKCQAMDQHDFTYSSVGSTVTLHPQTDDARVWCDANISPKAYLSPDTILVEYRYFPEILRGILTEQLTIKKISVTNH